MMTRYVVVGAGLRRGQNHTSIGYFWTKLGDLYLYNTIHTNPICSQMARQCFTRINKSSRGCSSLQLQSSLSIASAACSPHVYYVSACLGAAAYISKHPM